MIHSFTATLSNLKTGEVMTLSFDSLKGYLEAWEEAISFFNSELLKLDKTWKYDKVEHN